MKTWLLITLDVERARSLAHGVRRAALLFVLACLTATAWAAKDAVTVNVGGFEVNATRILARYRDAAAVTENTVPLQQAGLKVLREYDLVPGLVALDDADPVAASASSPADLRARLVARMEVLTQSGRFEFVEPDYIVHATATPTDAAFADGRLWGLRNYGQSGGKAGADISATNAWDLTTGSTNAIVAVIDTGIRYSHRDLRTQMWRNPGEIAGNNKDDDNNGFVDDVYGINAITGSGDPFDDNDHGTHVSGTIGAAANDGNASVGVTWRVRLMGCKFLSASGSGATSDAITCVNYAVSKGARILNNSWGGGGYSQALFAAINAARQKDVLFVAAAGNSANDNDQRPFYPCSYPLDNIISVAAVDRSDNLADFSNFGATTVHVGAPGVSIFSCLAGADNSYGTGDGTSMASPHVSGLAALILGLYPGADYTEMRQRILLGATPIPALNGKATTGGRLNAYKSLSLTGSGQLQMSVNPPSSSVLLTSSTQPIVVKVFDTFGVNTATVTASVVGVTNLTFANNGQPPDALANDSFYSVNFRVPASTNPLTVIITATAPGKSGVTNTILYSVLPPPPNDYFTNATKVPVGGDTYFANNRFATLETGEPRHNGSSNAVASLWWSWTPTNNTNMFVDLTGSRVDTILAVYTGNSVTGLTQVVSTNSDLTQHRPAQLAFSGESGRTHRIAIASASSNALGSIQARFAPGGLPDTTPPAVFVTSPLSGLTVFDRNFTVAGTAVDPTPNASGVMEVLVSLNGGLAYTANGTANWTVPALLTPGLNFIQASARDESGNVSSSVNVQINYVVPTPANDFFVQAASLTSTQGVVTGFSTNATKEVGEPAHAGNLGGKSLWWSFQAPADGVLTLDTTNSTFDTLLALHTGTSVEALTPVAANDDTYSGVPGGFSRIVQAVRSNTVYHVAVDGYDGVSGKVLLGYNFTPSTIFRLTINTTGGGVTYPSSGDVASNSTVAIAASPNPGFAFDRWTGDVSSRDNPLSTVVSGDLSLTANFNPMVFTDDFEAGNLSKLPWTTSGDVPWLIQLDVMLSGQYAARSGAIGDGQSSSLVLSTNFAGGLGSFFAKVSSEPGWDFLDFYVDGVLQEQWSGEVDWTSYAFPLSAGAHTLEWRYLKDASAGAGLDAAFIDNVNLPFSLPTDASTPARLTATRQADGSLLLHLVGQTNRQYVIQGTTNLAPPITWQTLSTSVATDGVINYVDPTAATNRLRFYRAFTPVP